MKTENYTPLLYIWKLKSVRRDPCVGRWKKWKLLQGGTLMIFGQMFVQITPPSFLQKVVEGGVICREPKWSYSYIHVFILTKINKFLGPRISTSKIFSATQQTCFYELFVLWNKRNWKYEPIPTGRNFSFSLFHYDFQKN